MPTLPERFASTACLLAALCSGCDSEAASTANDRIVVHADLSALRTAPALADAFTAEAMRADDGLGACGTLVRTARAATLGADNGTFELYVEGAFTAAAARACSDHITTKIAAKPSKDGAKVRTTTLADGMFVVHRGPDAPSRARMLALRDADPSPGAPAWLVAHDDAGNDEVEHVEAWLRAGKAVDAHLAVHFDSAKTAAEIYGKVVLGLTAMRLSDDTAGLAKAIRVSSAGDTLTAELHATGEMMRAFVANGSASAKTENDGASISVDFH